MRAFVPYLVLSVFFVACAILNIGGCAIDHNWTPLFGVVFAIIVIFFTLAFIRTDPSGDARVTEDAWMFLIFTMLTCCIAFPLLLYHVDILSWKGLTFQLVGDTCAFAGFGLFIYFQSQDEY